MRVARSRSKVTAMAVSVTHQASSFLAVADLDAEHLHLVLELAGRMKKEPSAWYDTLRGETLALLFEKPSTRTRVSFAAAAARLGMSPLALRPDELQLGRGEPLADTARVLSSYVAAIAIRTFSHATLEEFAAHSAVPVVNALSDRHHPCQALADLLTLHELFGRLEGRKLAFVGDGNNVAHSLIEACARAGVEIAVASPAAYAPDPEIVRAVRRIATAPVDVCEDPREAVADADAVYTDVWVSMGDEAERRERLRSLAPYRVDDRLMRLAAEEAVFLHCLPAHRGEEVTASVIDGPQSEVWRQAANRLPTEQAIVYCLVTGDWGGEMVEP
jgi:ornithine carbamoyltransferase